MSHNSTKYSKKTIFFISAFALCGFVLFLCSAGSDSNGIKNTNPAADINQNDKNTAKPASTFLLDDPNSIGFSKLNGTELFYKTMLAVFIVIVLGAGAIFVTKKYLPKIANYQGREIRIIETVHIGPRKSVHLLEIGSRRLLIGSTNENISRLADLTKFSTDMSIQESELD